MSESSNICKDSISYSLWEQTEKDKENISWTKEWKETLSTTSNDPSNNSLESDKGDNAIMSSFSFFDDIHNPDNQTLSAIEESQEFEDNFHKYYIDSSKNSNGNFDNYTASALTLITKIPKNNHSERLEKISKTIDLPSTETLNWGESNKKRKKTLLIDWDETLIHSDLDYVLVNHDIILHFFSEEDNADIPIPLFIRPGMFRFLDFASEYFEWIVFTASLKSYADAIWDFIEKDKKYFTMRWYREHCLFINPGLYIKDLRVWKDRELKDIVLIDNSWFSFANQWENGILITSFYNEKDDELLCNWIEYLKYLIIPCGDVREVNRENFHFMEYKEEIIRNGLI